MKVSSTGNHHLSQVYQNQTERTSQEGGSSATAARPIDRQDAVELSSQAQLLQKAAQAVERDDPERRARLDQLRTQVQNDTYEVPIQQLTARMMRELF